MFYRGDGKLKGWNLFGEIKQYKNIGLNKSQVKRTLNIGYNTVNKYCDMSNDEYAQLINQTKNRSKKIDGYKVKVYCFAMVLSHSRFKYLLWSDKPFNTLSFIDAHNIAFEYLGGMPK